MQEIMTLMQQRPQAEFKITRIEKGKLAGNFEGYVSFVTGRTKRIFIGAADTPQGALNEVKRAAKGPIRKAIKEVEERSKNESQI